MADRKISELTDLAAAAEPTDELVVYDPNAGTAAEKNKRVSLTNLLAYLVNRVADKCLRFTAPGSAPAVSGASEAALYTNGASLLASINGVAYGALALVNAAINWTGAHVWTRSGSAILAAGPTGATNPTFAVDTSNGGIILGRNRSDYSVALSMATSGMQFPISVLVAKPSDDGFENDNVYELNSNWDGAVATHPKWQMNVENFYRIPASGQRLIEVNWSYGSIDRAIAYRPFNFQVDVDTHHAEMNWRVNSYLINSRTGSVPFFSVNTATPLITAAAPLTTQNISVGSGYNLTFANAGVIRSTATHLDLQDNNTNRVHIAAGGGKVGVGTNDPQAQYEFAAVNKALSIGASTLTSGQATGLLFYAPNFGSAGLRWSNDSTNNLYLESANSSVTPNNWHDGASVNFVVRKGRLGINNTAPVTALGIISGATNQAAAILQQLTGTTATQPVLTINDAAGAASAHITGAGQIQFYDSGGGMRARLGMASWDNGFMSLQTGILSESAANAALFQSSNGETSLNSASGRNLNLKIANATILQIASTGTLLDVNNALRCDQSATANETRLLLWDVTAGTFKRVSRGAADSGGTGFRALIIPN